MYTCWKQPVSSMSVRFQLPVCRLFSSRVSDTGKRMPGLSVGPPRSMSAVGCLLMSALSRRRYAPHTCSLHDEIQASFCAHFVFTTCQCEPSACFIRRVRLHVLLIIITLGIGYQRRHVNRYIISYLPICLCGEWILTDIRYRSISRYYLGVPCHYGYILQK